MVLAGGQSSRMGQDKALIIVEGMPLIQRTCVIAQACATSVYVLTPWIERYQEVLPSRCQLIRETPTLGENQSHGPLVAFIQGLPYIKTKWVLLLACDLPFLNISEIQQWGRSLSEVSDEIMALIPKTDNHWQPLCGFYRRECLDSLIEFRQKGGKSFQSWLADESIYELKVSNHRILFNCNTTRDLDELRVCTDVNIKPPKKFRESLLD